MNLMIEILGYLFLIIFAVTAILTLLSLPGWVKIPEWYQKKLFIALLLEVVGAVVIFFNKGLLDNLEQTADNGIKPNPYAILRTEKEPSGHLKVQQDSVALGLLLKDSLAELGFYNAITPSFLQPHQNPIIKWTKGESGWSREGQSIANCPFKFTVDNERKGTKYMISNTKTGEMLFNSDSLSVKFPFNTDQRQIYFLEDNNNYYMYRIVEANLSTADPYFVHVLEVKLEPSMK